MLLILLVWLLLNKTNMGRIIRAVSQDKEMASMLSVNSGESVSLCHGTVSSIGWNGRDLGFSVFNGYAKHGLDTATCWIHHRCIRRVGNIWGTLLGAVIVAYAGMITAYEIDPQLRDAVTFTIMILALVFKPEGLFTKGVKE